MSGGLPSSLAGLDLAASGATPGAWLELAVEADPEAVEAVSEILARGAPGGTSVEPAYELVDEGLAARLDLERPAVVRACLPLGVAESDAVAGRGERPARAKAGRESTPRAVRANRPPRVREVIAVVSRIERELGHLQAFGLRPIGELRARIVHEADWADAWKRHFPVLRVGRRLVIRPTWRRHRRAERDVVLALDPGMAFGTGLHPTTRLCLAAVERLADRGVLAGGGGDGGAARVLDVGSGSGILSIAAARLGSGQVLAVDVDPIAVAATLANAKRNRVARLVRARVGSVPTGEWPFDVVLANLVASLLVRLADGLVADLQPGGTLVASGIFVDRESEVADAFRARGLRVTGRTTEGDWIALEARRG